MTKDKVLVENYYLDRIEELNRLIHKLDQGAASLRALADQVDFSYFNPSKAGELTDMGRSRRGCMITSQLKNELENYIFSIENPVYKQALLSLSRISDYDLVPSSGKLSRPKTNFQLLKQAKELIAMKDQLEVLRRRLIFEFSQQEARKKLTVKTAKLDQIVKIFQKRAENQGKGRE